MITIRMARAIAITLWLLGLLILWWNFAFGSQFGAGNLFGTAVFGSGSTTTSVVVPNNQGIIGGGIVKLPPELRKDEPDVIFFDKLMLQEEREWEESLD
jgi:hypothetical protein